MKHSDQNLALPAGVTLSFKGHFLFRITPLRSPRSAMQGDPNDTLFLIRESLSDQLAFRRRVWCEEAPHGLRDEHTDRPASATYIILKNKTTGRAILEDMKPQAKPASGAQKVMSLFFPIIPRPLPKEPKPEPKK